jgi:hypothetical protein
MNRMVCRQECEGISVKDERTLSPGSSTMDPVRYGEETDIVVVVLRTWMESRHVPIDV